MYYKKQKATGIVNARSILYISLYLLFPLYGITRFISSNFKNAIGQSLFNLFYLLILFILFKSSVIKKIIQNLYFSLELKLLFFIIFVGYVRAYLFDSHLIGFAALINSTIIYLLIAYLLQIAVILKMDVIKAISKSIMLYAVINILLFFVGFENKGILGKYLSLIPNVFKITQYREIVPLATGMADSAAIGIFSVLSAIGLIKYNRRNNICSKYIILYCIIAVIGVIILLMAGNRFFVINIIVSLFLFKVLNLYKNKSILILVLYGAFLFPLIYLPLSVLLYKFDVFNIFSKYTRGSSENIYTLSNRIFIWIEILVHFVEKTSLIKKIFGYGFYGQTISGVSENYSHYFARLWANTDKINAHNSFIQILLNYGIGGVIIYSVILKKTLYNIITNKNIKRKILTLLLFYGVIITSMIEVTLVGLSISNLLFVSMILIYNHNFVGTNNIGKKLYMK